MPYFFILPIYIGFIFVLALAAVVARFVPRLRSTSGYIVGGMVGTLPGIILANLIIMLAAILPMWASQEVELPQWLVESGKYVMLAILLVGPFVASTIGVIFGFVAGLYFVFRRRRKYATY